MVAEEHLDELERLVESAGGEVVGRILQDRAAPDPATYVGRGAVDTIGDKAREEDAVLVVFDDELTPGQVRNLEKRWGDSVTALDRPGLILDVFASHARTREARTQVDLAHLQYLLPRLAGRYEHLSGLAGGIGGEAPASRSSSSTAARSGTGSRGSGATSTRSRPRGRSAGRSRATRFQVAIAGYTNAGKTTLFNRLTRESAYAADRLFATLDSRAARSASSKLGDVVFVDTVGFVRKLPPSLVASFRSTLSEVRDADLVLHVLDASSPRVEEERKVAAEVMEELGVEPERILPVWTKTDLPAARAPRGEVGVSAVTGAGLETLERAIRARARPEPERFSVSIPYTDGRAIAAARAGFRVVEEQDLGDSLGMKLAGERRRPGDLSEYLDRGHPSPRPSPRGEGAKAAAAVSRRAR